jgi:hypothetical protein
MLQQVLTSIRYTALLSGAFLGTILCADESSAIKAPKAEELNYSRLATIPAWSDPASIRFEKIRMVKAVAAVKSTTNANYCGELAFRDPGGSMFCPDTQIAPTASLYELTYSYVGQPLASDESSSRRFTFRVYLRPEELAPEIRQRLSARTPDRADLAGYFALRANREAVRRQVVDTAQSKFCDGAYVDGAWVHANARCQDDVRYTVTSAPSEYITVKVDLAPAALRRAGVNAAE